MTVSALAAVQELFAASIGIAALGADDDYFAFGGHSLSAMALAARLSERFGTAVAAADIFERPTPRLMAAALPAVVSPASDPVIPPKPRQQAAAPIEASELGGAPLSSMEMRLWYHYRLAPKSAAYNEPFLFRLRGAIDAERLRRSVDAVVARHAALRSRYSDAGGAPRRTVVEAAKQSSVFTVDREGDAMAKAVAAARRPFVLEREAPIRFILFPETDGSALLLMTAHHIVLDERSVDVLLEDISEAYAAGGESLDACAAPYDDFAFWETGRIEDGGDAARDFWRAMFADGPPANPIPSDFLRTLSPSAAGGRVRLALDATASTRARSLAAALGATPFAVWLAVYGAYLGRIAGGGEADLAIPLSLRGDLRFDRTVGFCVNTVPVRIAANRGASLRELAAAVRDRMAGCLRHGFLPLDAIRHEAGAERGETLGAAFVMHHGPEPAPALPGVEAQAVPLDTAAAKFDLTAYVRDCGAGVALNFEYASQVLRRESAENLAARFARFAELALADPDAPLDGLPWMDVEERRIVLQGFNRTDAPYPRDTPIHERFAEQAFRTPEAAAIIDGPRRLTYTELNVTADRAAASLIRRGAGERIGVYCERSAEFIAAILAVLKSGAAYVPLDPSYPPARLRHIIADSGLSLIVTSGRSQPPLDIDAEQVAFAVLERASEPHPALVLPRPAGPSDSAYIMYTSGTTGRPKGVDVAHRGVMRLVCGVDYAALGSGERHLLLASTAFDASTFEIWAPLLNGGTCVVYPETHLDLVRLGAVLERESITCLWLTSTLFNAVVDHDPAILRGLRQLLIGGEALSPSHVRKALDALPEVRIVNGYGPTECTTFACTWPIPRDFGGESASVPIGRPIANTRAYILDREMAPVPVGVYGELYLAGDGLARGYINMPEATAERFLPDPFAAAPGARIYRTGDRCRWRDDGAIEFGGRLDGQVKIRGHRIELGEVEGAVASHGAVRQCAAVVHDGSSGAMLAVYAALHGGGCSADELRRHAADALPAPMRPAVIEILDALPMTPGGKVDRQALARRPLVPAASPEAESGAALPALSILREILNRTDAQADDDFFALGGDSLSAVRYVAAVNKRLGAALDLPSFFAAPTAAGVTQTLLEGQAPSGPIRSVTLRDGDDPPFFCIWGLGMFRRLADRLPAACAVCGLYGDEEVGGGDIADGLAALAAKYVDAMRARQPRGPYRIGGHSFGGLIAFEMARQLEAAGEPPEILALFDSIWAGAMRVRKRRRAMHALSRLREGGIAYLAARLRKGNAGASRERTSQMARYLADYHAGPYGGPAVLFRAEQTVGHPYMEIAGDFGWGALVPSGLTVVDVCGGHLTMFDEPHVRGLADAVAPFLTGAAQKKGGPPERTAETHAAPAI